MVVDHRADSLHNRVESVNSNMCSLVDFVDSRVNAGSNIISVVVVDHRADSVNNRAHSLVDVVDSMVGVGDHLGLSLSRALPKGESYLVDTMDIVNTRVDTGMVTYRGGQRVGVVRICPGSNHQ